MQKYVPLWIVVLCLSAQAVAQEPLEGNFVAPRIPLHLELDKSGFLAEMHKWLMEKANVNADLTVLPWARAMAMFEAEKVDGIYPSWSSSTYKVSALYTVPFMQVDHFIYSKAGSQVFSSLAELAGQRLGLIEHYQLDLDLSVQEQLSIHFARNSQALVTLLISGRVDAIILSSIEASALQKSMQIGPLAFDKTSVILSKYLGYVFQNNPKGAALYERINTAILDAQQSGLLSAHLQQAIDGFN